MRRLPTRQWNSRSSSPSTGGAAAGETASIPSITTSSTAHEVLGIAKGRAEVRFGGPDGATVAMKAGDAVLIPAGVGHKRLSASDDLLVIGAYPAGQRADLMREGAEDKAGIANASPRSSLPETDPVEGIGAMQELWASPYR